MLISIKYFDFDFNYDNIIKDEYHLSIYLHINVLSFSLSLSLITFELKKLLLFTSYSP